MASLPTSDASKADGTPASQSGFGNRDPLVGPVSVLRPARTPATHASDKSQSQSSKLANHDHDRDSEGSSKRHVGRSHHRKYHHSSS